VDGDWCERAGEGVGGFGEDGWVGWDRELVKQSRCMLVTDESLDSRVATASELTFASLACSL
jgi:hypothetical protein